MIELTEVTCPTCFENFGVPSPAPEECPCVMDYDCEVCCRPMLIEFWEEDEAILGLARGLDD